MEVNRQVLFKTISDNIKGLDKELESLNGSGIFFAPELYIAFLIGKEITRNKEIIFGSKDIVWDRERDLGNGGPSDIVFENIRGEKSEITAVFEFKLRDTVDAYKKDINKLLLLNKPDCRKFFCVLLDSFSKANDDRLKNLEKEYSSQLKLIDKTSFPVNQDWYRKQVYCILNLYEVRA